MASGWIWAFSFSLIEEDRVLRLSMFSVTYGRMRMGIFLPLGQLGSGYIAWRKTLLRKEDLKKKKKERKEDLREDLVKKAECSELVSKDTVPFPLSLSEAWNYFPLVSTERINRAAAKTYINCVTSQCQLGSPNDWVPQEF